MPARTRKVAALVEALERANEALLESCRDTDSLGRYLERHWPEVLLEHRSIVDTIERARAALELAAAEAYAARDGEWEEL